MSSADATPASSESTLAPEDVSDRTFPTAFRGFDPVEVRAFLGHVADELRAARQREAELRRALEEGGTVVAAAAQAEATAAAAAAAAAIAAESEEQAAATVASAREEAERMLREAKDRVAQLGHAASAESARVLDEARAQAQQLVRTKGEEAESVAVKKIADAEREAAEIRVKAREDADAILEAAKERGREMVSEAQAARERMIADLNKRKRAAAAQLDQLRAGRDRLLESLRVVRRNLDEITTRLEATEGVAPPVAASPDANVASPAPAVAARSDSTPEATSSSVRPVRSSRVLLGELPKPGPAIPAPPSAPAAAADEVGADVAPESPAVVSVRTTPSPRIDAPQAQSAAERPADAASASSAPPATGEQPATPAQEERKSSALRILRRNRGAASRSEQPVVAAPIGRETAGEGIRIISRTPEPEPAPAPSPEPEPEVEARVEPQVEAAAPPQAEPPDEAAEVVSDEVSEVDEAPDEARHEAGVGVDVVEVADLVEVVEVVEVVEGNEVVEVDVTDDELPPPLRPEEVRPKIEDLFARIRADREQAVAKARQVLSAGDEPTVADDEDAGEAPAPPAAATEAAAVEEEVPAAPQADGDEHLLQARDTEIDPLIGQLTRRLKRSIQDEQNATLDRLRTSRPRPRATDILAAPDTQPAPYRYASLPMLEQAARAASAAAPFGPVGVGVDDLAQTLAEEIASQIRVKVDRVLDDAGNDDLDLQATSERVSAVYREWKTQRVERVATHYLVAAWSRGTFVATPEGTPMRWVVDDDGPCPDCDDNALAGETPRGEPFPTGQMHPPAHPGCRCLLTPAHG